MEILRDAMRQGAWRSSRSMSVRSLPRGRDFRYRSLLTEMLTPIEQPLDKLEDLKQDEMYVCCGQ